MQLRQDFELVRELVGSERYGLAPETRQSLLSLRVFQQMDGAILCLLQQPGGLAGVPPRPWHSLRHCCESLRGGGKGMAALGCPMGCGHPRLRQMAGLVSGSVGWGQELPLRVAATSRRVWNPHHGP